jgi:hypothetical protein
MLCVSNRKYALLEPVAVALGTIGSNYMLQHRTDTSLYHPPSHLSPNIAQSRRAAQEQTAPLRHIFGLFFLTFLMKL